MENLVYAPPTADMDTSKAELATTPFFVVGKAKFVWLFFLTVGMYQFVWFYKNWSIYKRRCRAENHEDQDIWPLPRVIFAIFFIHSLYHKVEDFAEKTERSVKSFSVDAIATPTVLLFIASSILGRLSWNNIGAPYTDYINLLLLLPTYYFANLARNYVNEVSGDKDGKANAEFTAANWVWMVIGTLWWCLILIGTFMPKPVGDV